MRRTKGTNRAGRAEHKNNSHGNHLGSLFRFDVTCPLKNGGTRAIGPPSTKQLLTRPLELRQRQSLLARRIHLNEIGL